MSTPTTVSSARQSKAKRPPYRVYVAIFGAILAARLVHLATQGTELATFFQSSHYWAFFVCFSLVASISAALYFKFRLPGFIAWLLCGLVGGISMLIVDPLVGATTGFAAGGAILLKRTYYVWTFRFCLRALKLCSRTILPAVIIGALTGSMTAVAWLRYGLTDSRQHVQLLSVGFPLLLGGFVAAVLLRLMFRDRRWFGWISAILLFSVFALCSGIGRISKEMKSIRNSIETVNVQSLPLRQIVLSTIDPFAGKQQLEFCDSLDNWLLYFGMDNALGLGKSVNFTKDSTPADIDRVARFPFIVFMHVQQGCGITNAQFERLNVHHLSMLTCEENTHLTDEAFKHVDFSKLGNLELRGPNFGDRVLRQLKDVPWLATIALNGTQVTAEGLKQIDTTGPLYWLHLADTQIDDSVFSVIDKHDRLLWVDLSGTQVKGSGIKEFRTSLQRLTLDYSRFESKYLADFLPPTNTEATPWNALLVDRLSIAHCRFDEQLFDSLLRLSKSLKYLNVAGTGLPPEKLQKLGLLEYGLDAALLTPRNVSLLGTAQLQLHYDAVEMGALEIVEHFKQIKEARRSSITTKDAGLTLVIENLTLTAEAFRAFDEVLRDTWVELAKARTPDGKVKSFPRANGVYLDYPELMPPSERNQDDL